MMTFTTPNADWRNRATADCGGESASGGGRMIDLALSYAAQQWPVFPLVAGGKVPAIIGGHGYRDATTDPAQIRAWWSTYPNSNIGLATGRPSGVLVLDIDVKGGKPGLHSLRKLSPPPTFTVATPSGGRHLYFLMPPGIEIGIGVDIVPGIDWRGTGGYVVAPGSKTSSGVYEVMENLPLAALPANLVQLLRRGRRRPAIAAEVADVMTVPVGRRNDSLMRLAGALRRLGIGAVPILAALRGLNTELCCPPLSDTDLQRIAESAAKYPPGGRGL